MAGIEDLLNVNIVAGAAGVTQAGFGVPLILGSHTRFPELVRTYTDTAGMLADGFLAADPEYLAAQALTAQSPRPSRFKAGRRTRRPAQRYRLTPVVVNSTKYAVKVNGVEVSFTSDASATAAEITAGLKAAIDALAVAGVTTDATTVTTQLDITTAVGGYVSVEVVDPALLASAENHADAGVAADLADLALVDNDWYGLELTTHSEAEVNAAAAWVESARKLFVPSSSDTAIITTAAGGATDTAADVKTANYARTAVIYHPNPRQFAGCRWMGARLWTTPGSETWKFATLKGLDTTKLTATHLTNLRGKNCNFFYEVGGVSFAAEGKVGAGEWIDIVRGIDWLRARIAEGVLQLQVDAGARGSKVPYTDAGIAQMETVVRARLQDGETNTFLAPGWTVQTKLARDIATADKVARTLPASALQFFATAQGAIHGGTIQGSVTV